jgi:hypothetical protein
MKESHYITENEYMVISYFITKFEDFVKNKLKTRRTEDVHKHNKRSN